MTALSDNNPLEARFSAAQEMAIRAGAKAMEYFCDSSLKIELKENNTPVTQADRESELLLRKLIAEQFPDDGILGEEFDDVSSSNGWNWVIDPIDGTESFARGVPLFGVLIGVERKGHPQIGVVFLPALGELVYGGEGMGAFWRPNVQKSSVIRARVSSTSKLNQALICHTSAVYHGDYSDCFHALMKDIGKLRGWGDCYGHVLVATGRADAMIDLDCNHWDHSAIYPIIEQAGGRVTTPTGRGEASSGQAISSNGTIHNEILGYYRNEYD